MIAEGVELLAAVEAVIADLEEVLDRPRLRRLAKKDQTLIVSALRKLEPVRSGLAQEIDSAEPEMASVQDYGRIASRVGRTLVGVAALATGVANAPTAYEHLVTVGDAAIEIVIGDQVDGDKLDQTNPKQLSDDELSETLRRVLAEQLRRWREHQALTQQSLSFSLGVTPTSLSRWERQLALPSADNLTRIVELGIADESLEELAVEWTMRQQLRSNRPIRS